MNKSTYKLIKYESNKAETHKENERNVVYVNIYLGLIFFIETKIYSREKKIVALFFDPDA